MKQRYLLVFLSFFLGIAGSSSGQTTIFDYGSTWKYLDNGTNQGTAWTSTSFTDGTWASDTGFFGYGDPWITKLVNACGTVVASPSCSNKYITTYFRKVVNMPSTAIYDSVTLNVKRDDGVVVYVNGVEVWRDPNLPTGVMTYTTTATTALGGVDEYTPITKRIPISYFANGNNTIAVEVHQQSGTSSDLGFNMQMIATPSLTLFDFGSAWKYLDNGSNQGTAWTAAAFGDGAWASDTGFFGYGDPWITKLVNACGTVVASPSCSNKYITTYFRKAINIANPALFDSVRFNVKRDDGVVVYVNGVEVMRDPNMPTGVVTYTTTATTALGGIDEYTPITKGIPISSFSTGSNTIAVEVHQQAGTSSDLGFNMQAIAVPHVAVIPVSLAQGPYLQKGSKTAVNIRWRTNIASKSRVQLGTVSGTYPITVSDAVVLTEHEVRVTGLTPDTKYFYRFGTDTNIIQGDTTNFFVTAPADTSTRRVTLAAFGDCGRNDNSFQTGSLTSYQNYLASQNMKAADLMLLIGDNAYDAGTDAEFSTNFFSRYSGNVLKNHMLFPCPGNHDYANDATRQVDHNVPYYSLFSLPSAGESGGLASGTEAYYSYDWGNIHFLSLDSYGEENAGTTRLYDTSGAQVTWIKNDLAANTKKWTIAYWHHPPFTMGSHNSDAEGELISIRQNFIRILERYGVDLIICGHSHDYERSYLLKNYFGTEASFNKSAHTTDSSSAMYNGTTNSCPYLTQSGKVNHGTVYVVSGSAGADGGVQSGYPHNALPFSIDDGGMFFVDIKDNRLDAKFLRRDNSIADQFSIMKDVKVKDTITIFPGTTVNLAATWPGAYAWNTGATTRNISISPVVDTMITVKDSVTRTCITDQHFIDVICTMPAFTACPGNITLTGCNAIGTYVATDTARPTPALTYTFSGATTATGTGAGSGSTFNTGVTNVTITATNTCGSTNCNFTVTVNPLPATVVVSGTGTYCNAATITAANGGDGTIYFQGTTSGGTSTSVASVSQVITSSGTYYFRARGSDGCWGAEGSAVVTINSLPVVYNVTGGGNYCSGGSGVAVGLANSQSGIGYQLYNGASTVASPVSGTGAAIGFGNIIPAGTYTVSGTNTSTGCRSSMTGSATVVVYTLPTAFTVTGTGSYCAGGAGLPVGLSASQTGNSYQLFNGSSLIGAPVTGGGAAITFGNITAAGIYTVTATDGTTGCTNAMSGNATITVNLLPIVHNVTGGGHYCASGTGVVVGIDLSQSGINYQLYNGSTATGSAVTGTGAAISFGSLTTAGTYTVSASDITTGCTSNMAGSGTVSIDPLPVVYNVTGGGTECAGGAGFVVSLSNSETGIGYQLYNGSTTVGSALSGTGSALSFGARTVSGLYTVVASNSTTSCASTMSGSSTVVINPLPIAYTVTGSGRYCAGTGGLPVALSNSQTGITYQLFAGTSPVGTPVSGSGSAMGFGNHLASTYTIVATDLLTTCSNNMSAAAVITEDPLPLVFTVTGGGHYCATGSGRITALTGSESGITYQLYNGTTTVGSAVSGTGSSISFGLHTVNGTYTVVAGNTATGCTSNMTSHADIVIDALPVVYSVTGGGAYCDGGAGLAINLSGSAAGMRYQLFRGTVTSGVPFSGTGLGIAFGLQTAGGNYTVVATDTTTGCTSNMASSATIVVNPLPAINSVSGGGSYCAGGTGVHVRLGGSSAGVKYQLSLGGVPSGSAVAGTDVPLDFGLQTLAGIYKVMATDAITGCYQAMYDSAIVAITPLVTPSLTITANPGISVCSGTAVTYRAVVVNGGIAPTYQWRRNAASVGTAAAYSYTPSSGDRVSLVMHTSAACRSVDTATAALTMEVDSYVMPTVSVAVNPGISVCDGSPLTFTATPGYGGATPSFSWIVNTHVIASGPVFTYTPGKGDVVLLSMNSSQPCRLANTVYSPDINLNVNDVFLPSVTIAASPGTTVKAGQRDTFTASVFNGGGHPSFQWVKNSRNIAGATNSRYVGNSFAENDTIACQVTGTGSCGLRTMNLVVMHIGDLSVNEVGNNSSITVQPNPNKGSFVVEGTLAGTDEDAMLAVTDVLGQTVYTARTIVKNGVLQHEVVLGRNVANGMYLLNIRCGQLTKTFRVVVNR